MRSGTILRERRESMGLSLTALTNLMNGSPGASFISKMETGERTPTRNLAVRLADALVLPRAMLLNAAGYATPEQEAAAIDELRRFIREAAPKMTTLVAYDETGQKLGTRPRLVRTSEESMIVVDLLAEANAPFVGEAVVSTSREPKDGSGVVVEIEGRWSAWTYRQGKSPFIENGAGERRAKWGKTIGVILRVVQELSLE